jgi:hypothetical protein
MVKFTDEQIRQIFLCVKKAGKLAIRDDHWPTLSERKKTHLFMWYLRQQLVPLVKETPLQRLKKFFYKIIGDKIKWV